MDGYKKFKVLWFAWIGFIMALSIACAVAAWIGA